MVEAVVEMVTVTVCDAPLSCTVVPDKLQLGAGDADGVMLQLRFTAPVKLPAGATAILNCASCPRRDCLRSLRSGS